METAKTHIYLVATPIGNLEDITLRALRILREVPYIFCEDTRVTKVLLEHFEIKNKKVLSYHHHSDEKKVEEIKNILKSSDAALVTDAGTPGISDPGNRLISEIVESGLEVEIVPIPGPSALITALSVSGFPTDKFIFKGFVPHKNGREKFLKESVSQEATVAFYESPHRIMKTLEFLSSLEESKEKHFFLARELTKKFETLYRGDVKDILSSLKKQFPSGKIKGEFVLAIS